MKTKPAAFTATERDVRGMNSASSRAMPTRGDADHYQNGDETSYAMIAFEAEIKAGNARPDGVEILEVGFFTPAELENLEMPRWMPEILEGVLESGGGAAFDPPTWRPPARS